MVGEVLFVSAPWYEYVPLCAWLNAVMCVSVGKQFYRCSFVFIAVLWFSEWWCWF